MKHYMRILIITISIIPTLLMGYEYNLCIGAMFRDEARWLKEWIEFHRLIGVDHFYLYDNDSQDNFEEVLTPYIEQGIVEVIPWKRGQVPYSPGTQPEWVGYQHTAYRDCAARAKHKTKWLAIIDIDEFIVPERGIDEFRKFLDDTAKTNIGELHFYWKVFGTSNYWDIPEDRLMTEMLVMRAPNGTFDWQSKAFYRPEAVIGVGVHGGALLPGWETVFSSEARLNHYQYRARKDSCLKRWGHTWVGRESDLLLLSLESQEWMKEQEDLYNAIEDRTIQTYLPALKKVLQH